MKICIKKVVQNENFIFIVKFVFGRDGELVEIAHDVAACVRERFEIGALHVRLADVGPLFVERVGGAFFVFVGASFVEAPHEHIAVDECLDGAM